MVDSYSLISVSCSDSKSFAKNMNNFGVSFEVTQGIENSKCFGVIFYFNLRLNWFNLTSWQLRISLLFWLFIKYFAQNHCYLKRDWISTGKRLINPFVPNAPFLYSLKISENRKIVRFSDVFRG